MYHKIRYNTIVTKGNEHPVVIENQTPSLIIIPASTKKVVEWNLYYLRYGIQREIEWRVTVKVCTLTNIN